MFRKRKAKADSLFQLINSTTFNTGNNDRRLIYSLAKDNLDMIKRMKALGPPLNVHNGCVNSVCWNEAGTVLLSGSDDQHIKIVDPFGYKEKVLADYKTSHRSNIFCARFLPFTDDSCVVSAAGDGSIVYTDLNAERELNDQSKFLCHEGTCYKVLTLPSEPHTFLSCGEDGTVRHFDLRLQQRCHCNDFEGNSHENVIIRTPRPVTSMSVNPHCSYELAVGVADSSIKIYDRRNSRLGSKVGSQAIQEEIENGHLVRCLTVPELDERERYYRITSVQYNSSGTEILASFSSEAIYLFSLEENTIKHLCPENHTSKPRQPAAMKRLRLRGDWSDTGPLARPAHQSTGEIGQARPTLHASLMDRMTLVLSQMLNETPQTSGRSRRLPSQNPLGISESESEAGAIGGGVEGVYDRHPHAPIIEAQVDDTNTGLATCDDDGAGPLNLSSSAPKSTAGNSSSTGTPSSKLIPIRSGRVVQRFKGHRNARTMIKEVNFWGEKFIISGSDCGHIFFWDRNGELVNVIEADSHVVNCIQPHPSLPILASSGIDYNVKLWTPLNEQTSFDRLHATELTRRNELLLEETKDTITVPAAFMIRMLNCLNQIRRSSPQAAAAAEAGSSSAQGQRQPSPNEREGNQEENRAESPENEHDEREET